MTEPLVETTSLTKDYGPNRAIDRVDLQVRRGEIYGFLGPNGAGKTTTLRILLGLMRPSSGTVRVLGRAPGEPAALARLGMLVEAPAFYPYLSGRDNLLVFARYASVPATRADAALEAVDLTSRGRDRAGTYSLGMKQRLGVATALLKNPELLILDEPTNGLDPAGMADMRGLIRRLGRDGHTVLLSSHLLGEVQQVCDRVGVLSRGRLLRQAAVDELRGGRALRVEAEPLDTARALAERMLGADRVTVEDRSLRLEIDPESATADATVADLNRQLALSEVAVHSVGWHERSLEDIFFELTGGNVDRSLGEEGTP